MVREYVGGYTDWVRQRPVPVEPARPTPARREAAPVRDAKPAKRRKLTYKEAAELEALPERIDAVEREREGLYGTLADPATQRDAAAVLEANAKLAEADRTLEALLARWEALETVAAGS